MVKLITAVNILFKFHKKNKPKDGLQDMFIVNLHKIR